MNNITSEVSTNSEIEKNRWVRKKFEWLQVSDATFRVRMVCHNFRDMNKIINCLLYKRFWKMHQLLNNIGLVMNISSQNSNWPKYFMWYIVEEQQQQKITVYIMEINSLYGSKYYRVVFKIMDLAYLIFHQKIFLRYLLKVFGL